MSKGQEIFNGIKERYEKAYRTYNNKAVTSLTYEKGFVVIKTDVIHEMKVRVTEFKKMLDTLEARAESYPWKEEQDKLKHP